MFSRSFLYDVIQDDLKSTEGNREKVKASFLEKIRIKKLPVTEIHVNPEDEFTFPNIGPNEAIVENYCQIALRSQAMGEVIYEEPVMIFKLKNGGYMLANGHHRWAGAMKAFIPKIHVHIID